MSEARSEEMGLARPMRRKLGWTALLLLAVAAFWLGGFLWFAQQIPQAVGDLESETDAIVVLTGGSQRVQSGLSLLAAGKAKKLFISGVYHGTDVAALLRVSHQSPEHVACCIVLGHEADNTLGNALETAQWMRQEGFRSLRLVTASYHMPRSLLEFSRAMPEVRIVAHPVFPERDHADRWWASARPFAHVLAEYHKYLLALSGVRSMREGEGGG
ncbi:MAG TPA: YdcF family protein [Stellaceae bacterium]|nr:YdcF family protein [Stellaceae bacterium]